jgi:hypothetical protein
MRLPFLLTVLLGLGCASRAPCTTGESAACTCTDGAPGAQVCGANHTFGFCVCQEAFDAGACVTGQSVACTCTSGQPGAQVCTDGQAFGPCACDAPDAGACVPGASVACACTDGRAGAQQCTAARAYDACACTGTLCVEGQSVACACTDGRTGAQVCSAIHTYGACTCTGAPDAGAPDAGASDGGFVRYQGRVDDVDSLFANLPEANGLSGVAAADAECAAIVTGADHLCTSDDLLAVEAARERAYFASPVGLTAWLERTQPMLLNGVTTAPGPGGDCDGWSYAGTSLAEGEYVSFDTAGHTTWHLDADTVFDVNAPGVHTTSGLPCGGVTRALLCCATPP